MRPATTIVSFVSGKGGVGKTSLAVNFAWLCSRVSKTLLIDMDFQNQGCTGVFLTRLPSDISGMLEQLVGCAPVPLPEITEVGSDLFFMPSVSLRLTPEYRAIASMLQDPGLGASLHRCLDHLIDKYEFVNIVLDCHGGLDCASVAAHHVSDRTIVVTEADTVTFNGTLELLDFYEVQEPATPLHQEMSPPFDARLVSFILNRVPPKYEYRDINAVYKRLIANYEGNVKLDPEVLSFVPEETFVAESFGEYPFCVSIAPKSIFARKLQLLVIDLLPSTATITTTYPELKRFKTAKFRKAMRQRMLSAENRNIRNIISAFGWFSTAFVLALIIYVIALFTSLSGHGADAAPRELLQSSAIRVLLVTAVLACSFSAIRAQFGLMFYYRDAYRFRRELLRVLGGPVTVWQRLSLFKLWVLRLGNSIGPFLVMLIGSIYSVGIIVLVLGLAK